MNCTARSRSLVSRLPRDPRSLICHRSSELFASVLCLRDYIGTEGVGLDDVRACVNIFLMNRLDYLRACEIEALVVAFQFFITLKKRTIVVVLFCKSVFLDHCAHGTVQYKYLFV